MKTRLTLASIFILAAGLCSAALIYVYIDDSPPPGQSFIIVDGIHYPVDVQRTKRYVRELERFGGKASVVFDDLLRWFDSLWHGKTLAFTVAFLSAAAALGLFLFARLLR